MTDASSSLRSQQAAFTGRIEINDPVDEARLPHFEDPVWDLHAQVSRRNARRSQCTIDFRTIPDQTRRQVAREFLALRLHPTLSRPDLPCAPTTAVAEFSLLRRFLGYLDEHHDGVPLEAVDQRVLDAWMAFAAAGRPGRQPLGPSGIRRNIDIPIKLHRLASRMRTQRLLHLPWDGRPARHVAGEQPTKENTTPRIPEPVIAPLLRAALAYVDVFADDILSARDEWRSLRDRREDPRRTVPARERLREFVEQRRQAGRGLPAVSTARRSGHRRDVFADLNVSLTAMLAGLSSTAFANLDRPYCQRLRDDLAAAHDELGTEPGGLWTRPAVLPATGRRWCEGFSPWDLEAHERQLAAACLVVRLYLTGMRESEVVSLRRGCAYMELSADGVLERHKVRGTVYKGRQATGEDATWVTLPEVHRAIAVLERLSDDDWLFAAGHVNDHTMKWASLSRELIRDFRDHVNADHERLGLDPIPDVDGEPWAFTGRQFRRTVAWHIANRPFGVFAGSIQFQHLSTAMFEGYAGSRPSGFRAEVEAERAFARLDELTDRFDEFCQGHPVVGPGADRLTAEFTAIRDHVGPLPGRVAQDRRVRQMIEHLAATLHAGALNDCLYDESAALCRSWAPTGHDGPIPIMCQPTLCPNSSLMPRHASAWRQVATDIDAMLARPQLPVVQQQVLQAQQDNVTDVLADLERADGR